MPLYEYAAKVRFEVENAKFFRGKSLVCKTYENLLRFSFFANKYDENAEECGQWCGYTTSS